MNVTIDRMPNSLTDLQEQLFRSGQLEASDFILAEVRRQNEELDEMRKDKWEHEYREDNLAYGMMQIHNLVEELEQYLHENSRWDKKEVLARVKEIKNDFTEYI